MCWGALGLGCPHFSPSQGWVRGPASQHSICFLIAPPWNKTTQTTALRQSWFWPCQSHLVLVQSSWSCLDWPSSSSPLTLAPSHSYPESPLVPKHPHTLTQNPLWFPCTHTCTESPDPCDLVTRWLVHLKRKRFLAPPHNSHFQKTQSRLLGLQNRTPHTNPFLARIPVCSSEIYCT